MKDKSKSIYFHIGEHCHILNCLNTDLRTGGVASTLGEPVIFSMVITIKGERVEMWS